MTFAIGTDLNFAQVLVQNRVSAAMASLPQQVQVQGVTVQQKSTSILEIVSLRSPDASRDSLYLSNYAAISLVNELARVPGVGNVVVFGVGQYAMRIWLDPDAMQTRGLTPADVIGAVQQQSQQVTAGQIGTPPAPASQNFQYTVNVEGRLTDPAQFGNIVVKGQRANGGTITRVKRCRAGRTWCANLYAQLAPSTVNRRLRYRDFSVAERQRAERGDVGQRQDGGAGEELSGRCCVRRAV